MNLEQTPGPKKEIHTNEDWRMVLTPTDTEDVYETRLTTMSGDIVLETYIRRSTGEVIDNVRGTAGSSDIDPEHVSRLRAEAPNIISELLEGDDTEE